MVFLIHTELRCTVNHTSDLIHFTCNNIIHCLRSMNFSTLDVGIIASECGLPNSPCYIWSLNSVPPGTSTIYSPPGPRRIQQYKDPFLCSHQNISLAYHAQYRTNTISYHLCVPDTAVKSLLPSLCCRYGSNSFPVVIAFLGLQWILPCYPCVPGMAIRSPLLSLCSWHGNKVSPVILVFLAWQ